MHGSESRQFYVLHIYDRKLVAEKGYWVPYSRGQLTASLTSDTLKVLVSSRNRLVAKETSPTTTGSDLQPLTVSYYANQILNGEW